MLISSELSEILGLSDRIYVMQNGRISGELDGKTATEEAVLGLAIKDHFAANPKATEISNQKDSIL
jgi:L-arabinose transport system ATP-binding protein